MTLSSPAGMARLASEESLPGTIWNNNGRWWWRVKLPGDAQRRAIPLKAAWMVRATINHRQALEIAWRMWREHEQAARGQAPAVNTVAELRRQWLAQATDTDELNTRPVMALAQKPADTIRASDLLAIREKLLAERREDDPGRATYSVSTVNRRIRAIVRMFRWGVVRDLVSSEQWWAMQAITPAKASAANAPRQIRPADMAAVQVTLAVCRPTLWRMIVTQMLTGMRSGELVRMRPCDIDRSGEVWIYTVPKHKTSYKGHVRAVAIGPRVQEVIAPLLDNRPATAALFSPVDAEAERGVERRADQRKPLRASYTPDTYQNAIEYAIGRAGVEHWHAHQLRHLAGTVARDASSLDGAQALLGHRHARVTEIYAELAMEKAAKLAAEIG